MKIIFLGIQGSGKSTQGNLLANKFNIPYLSTGHIFREIAKEKTKTGRYIKELINSGYLIQDDKTLEIVEEYLRKPLYQSGYILDGFPRTVTQAKAFKKEVDCVIYLRISDREALWRLSNRQDDREDETLTALRKRIELFHKFTEQVVDYYKREGKLIEVDGEKTIEKINKEIIENIKKNF